MDDVVREAHAYYRLRTETLCGGCLHAVLDDGNLDDECVRWAREYAVEHGDREAVTLADMLMGLTESEREEVFARYEEYGKVFRL